jgi:hypothetical protein
MKITKQRVNVYKFQIISLIITTVTVKLILSPKNAMFPIFDPWTYRTVRNLSTKCKSAIYSNFQNTEKRLSMTNEESLL